MSVNLNDDLDRLKRQLDTLSGRERDEGVSIILNVMIASMLAVALGVFGYIMLYRFDPALFWAVLLLGLARVSVWYGRYKMGADDSQRHEELLEAIRRLDRHG